MIEKLFSYGTLQLESVQIESFGRKLKGRSNILLGYEARDCLITDTRVVNASGKSIHPIACFTGNLNDVIPGILFEVSKEELAHADKYEVDDYKRVRRTLKSGEPAWVYVQSGLNIDPLLLQNGPIRLEIFQDGHVPALTEKAREARIWEFHRNNFQDPNVFKSIAIEKAKKAVANKNRYVFVIYNKNEIIGSTSYYNVDLDHLSLYIGYSWLHPDYWGTGINSIVKKMLINYAFKQLKFKRVAFCIDTQNGHSISAIKKLGISFEGIFKKHLIRPDGSSRDSVIYAITDEEWK